MGFLKVEVGLGTPVNDGGAGGRYRRGASATQGRGYPRVSPSLLKIDLYTTLESSVRGVNPRRLQQSRKGAAAFSDCRRVQESALPCVCTQETLSAARKARRRKECRQRSRS